MFIRIIFKFFVFVFVLFVQWNVPAVSQTQKLNQNFRPFTDLTLELSSPAETLLPLKPIPVIIKQSNRTNQPILGYNSLSFRSYLSLYVQKVGSDDKTQISPLTTLSGLVGNIDSEVLPGSSCEAKEWISLAVRRYFPEAGTYELQARLVNGEGTQVIESNRITIEIQEPTGRNREVYNLIRNSPTVDYLFTDAEFDKHKNLLETIATRFQNSDYAKSVFYVLGERHYVRNQHQQALVYFLRLENDNGFVFAEKVRKYLASIRQDTPIELLEEN